jgi:site-specific recombinase XerD
MESTPQVEALLESWMRKLRADRKRPATLLAEDEIDADPMATMSHPSIEEKVPEVISEADLEALRVGTTASLSG